MFKSAWARKIIWSLLSRRKMVTYVYKYRNAYRLKAWQAAPYQFIHIPKCAGTSIVKALNVSDPGHFSYIDLLERGVVDKQTPIFAVVRNPVDKVISTYSYTKKLLIKNGPHPLEWITKFSSVDDFVLNGLTQKDVTDNYFLHSNYAYIKGCNKSNAIIIDFDDLNNGFEDAMNAMSIDFKPLTKENVSAGEKDVMSEPAKAKIRQLYADDYAFMSDYLKISW